MSIEDMIKKGCTLEEAHDALDNFWNQTVENELRAKEVGAARTRLLESYSDYLKALGGEYDEDTILKENVAKLEKMLKLTEDLSAKLLKTKELQQKSKEQTSDRVCAAKDLDDFLKQMGW